MTAVDFVSFSANELSGGETQAFLLFFTGAAFDADTNTLILSGTWGSSGMLVLHALKVGG